jgi:hypothetical protein
MNRQLSAERTRRAVITESEGARQSAINVAEGQKQSEILKAEGERQAAILRAEGFSQALERIFAAARLVDEKTKALQYLEALKSLGASPSTKYVIRPGSPGSRAASATTSSRDRAQARRRDVRRRRHRSRLTRSVVGGSPSWQPSRSPRCSPGGRSSTGWRAACSPPPAPAGEAGLGPRSTGR